LVGEERTARDIVTPASDLVTLSPSEEADDALRKLQKREVRQLAVLANGRLIGLLRRRDILRCLQSQGEEIK